MARKTVKRVKTGSLERRFSMARAGFLAGARYATASAGGLFAAPDQREARRRRNLSQRAEELVEELNVAAEAATAEGATAEGEQPAAKKMGELNANEPSRPFFYPAVDNL